MTIRLRPDKVGRRDAGASPCAARRTSWPRANHWRGRGAAFLKDLARPFADLPLIDRFDCDITAALQSGDLVRVDPACSEVGYCRAQDS
jgi:hypothetical protein